MSEKEEILNFWFKKCNPEQWFRKDPAFDKKIRELFYVYVEEALIGKLENWSDSENGCLALILILDQFTRNIFRGSSRAFSGDKKALKLSFKCFKNDYLNYENKENCRFMLLPMMHSEDIYVQDFSLPLFKNLNDQSTYEYAIRHRDIVKQFGRFPHRNLILGRKSTEEEIEFLKHPGSSF
tara:strand:+ start:965 stop:1507 length:543 start_codon:yes stop_codon:yes gene_type:complete